MEQNAFKRAWGYYRARKSKVGVITDFLFLLLAVVVLIPQLRFNVMVWLSRIALSQPIENEHVEYIDSTGIRLQTFDSRDTIIMQGSNVVELYNFGGTWSPQSCAELRSLDKLSHKYGQKIRIFYITDEQPDVAIKYFNRHHLIVKPLFYKSEDMNDAPEVMQEIVHSVPATLVVSPMGRIVVKSVGAAKWTGSNIEAIIESQINTHN